MGVLRPPSSGLRRASRARIPSRTLRALAISHAPARALGLKAAVVLPFEQLVGALIHPQSVGAIDLGRQASRDLMSEATKPRKGRSSFLSNISRPPTNALKSLNRVGLCGRQLSVENSQPVLLRSNT